MPARPINRGNAEASSHKGNRRPVAWFIRGLKIAAASVGLIAVAIGGYWGALQYAGNFHTVTAGVLYRSAQLSGSEIGSAAHQYGIKSVLNLRGAHQGQAWYDDEVAAAKKFGLAHFDYPLSSKRFVTLAQISDILDIVKQAPKPLLIHCKSGADRTGLVAALYRLTETGASAAEADEELSLVYGHFPYLTSRSGAMDDSFWAFVHGTGQTAAK